MTISFQWCNIKINYINILNFKYSILKGILINKKIITLINNYIIIFNFRIQIFKWIMDSHY